jgi:hypothetical protein
MIMLSQTLLSKLFIAWIAVILCGLAVMVTQSDDEGLLRFYHIGPRDDLVILGIKIDTSGKYMIVIIYSLIGSIFRTCYYNVMQPWIINNVQDESRSKKHLDRYRVYETCTINVIYHWVDWLLYMNILLAQIDMMIVEIIADLMTTLVLTRYYLSVPKTHPHANEELMPLHKTMS